MPWEACSMQPHKLARAGDTLHGWQALLPHVICRCMRGAPAGMCTWQAQGLKAGLSWWGGQTSVSFSNMPARSSIVVWVMKMPTPSCDVRPTFGSSANSFAAPSSISDALHPVMLVS